MKHLERNILICLLLGEAHRLPWVLNPWYVAIYCRDMQVCILMAIIFNLFPKTYYKERSFILLLTLYFAVSSQFIFLINFSGYDIYWITYLSLAFICWTIFVYNRQKQYSFPSDKIKNTNYYICLWKPKTTATTLFSLLGFPVGGVSIYCPMQWWGYRWRKTTYMTEDLTPETIAKSFVVIDTGVCSMVGNGKEIKVALNNLVGTPAGFFRWRCIKTIVPVLKMLGEKYAPKNWFEMFPSIWSKKVLSE